MKYNEPNILFETDDIVAVNKPAGLVVHFDGKTKEPNLVEWMEKHFLESVGVGEPLVLSTGDEIVRSGVVHRLDRETSGVILLARNQEIYEHLKGQFKKNKIRKTYRAFVYGEIKQTRGNISKPIAKSKGDFRKFSTDTRARGNARPAETIYHLLHAQKDASYISVLPQTGRTHQIRVHMLSIHHPVVCDKLYAPRHECMLGFDRLALHAYEITFKDMDGVEHTITAPIPEDFLRAERALGVLEKSDKK